MKKRSFVFVSGAKVKKNTSYRNIKISIFTWNVGLLADTKGLSESKNIFHKTEIIHNSE